MNLVELKDIHKRESPIHYRSDFQGAALFEFTEEKQEQIPVSFSIEHTAEGMINVSVQLLQPISYPLLPVLKVLKSRINTMLSEGKLI